MVKNELVDQMKPVNFRKKPNESSLKETDGIRVKCFYFQMKKLCFGLLILVLLGAMIPAFASESTPAPIVISAYSHPLIPSPDVPASGRVSDMYFDGAVLVGDSLADGLAIHDLIPEMMILSRIGLSPRTAASSELFKQSGRSVTAVDKLAGLKPAAIYLWLGTNGLDSKPADSVIEDYDRLLNRLLKKLPETPVFLLEVTPVQILTQQRYDGFTNARIDKFNSELRSLAIRHNVYVLPINALLKDADGLLAVEYAGKDGIHLQQAGYSLVADYMYTHVNLRFFGDVREPVLR